jgi:hypothetical protein
MHKEYDMMNETSTGLPEMFSWRVDLLHNATKFEKEVAAKNPLPPKSKMVGVPGQESSQSSRFLCFFFPPDGVS